MHNTIKSTLTKKIKISSGERSKARNGQNASEGTRNMEAVLWPEISRLVSRTFPIFSAGSIRKSLENPRKFPVIILFPSSYYFPYLPAGSDDFPASFLQDPERFGDGNYRYGSALHSIKRIGFSLQMIVMLKSFIDEDIPREVLCYVYRFFLSMKK